MLRIFRPRGPGHLPTFLIIGAAKCGTTSLHYYLDLHPEIAMSWEKEIRFFNHDYRWRGGIEWYRRHFVGEAKAYGEASVGYTHYPTFPSAPERIHSVVPDVKLIYIVRDPIERTVSDYVHQFSEGNENRPLDEVLADLDGNPFAPRSKYYMQIERYLPYFPREQLLVLDQHDLLHRRLETLRDIFRFIGVDETFESPKFTKVKHKTADKGRKGPVARFLKRLSETAPAKVFSADFRRQVGKVIYPFFSTRIERPVLGEELRARLADYLKDDVERFREFCGRDFANWSV